MSDTIRWERGDDSIVVLTLDDPARGANTMNQAYVQSMGAMIDRLEAERDDIAGVIITSAKKSWFAGGDLDRLRGDRPDQADEAMRQSSEVKAQLRRLETLGRPVVAALNGSALGGGLEIALACHRRIALDDPRLEVGAPEVTLGLLPAGGGVVRSVRLLGLATALTEVLLTGARHRAPAARQLGLIDELVPDRDALMAAARTWIDDNPDAAQPWDRPGYRIPGGIPLAQLPAFPANLQKKLKGAPYPAPKAILCAAVEGAQLDLDTAFTIEARYFAEPRHRPDREEHDPGVLLRPERREQARHRRGAAGAQGGRPGRRHDGRGHRVRVRAGPDCEVVLRDVTTESAARGKAYSEGLVSKDLNRKRTTESKARELLDRITPTADLADLAGADLVIEAVFEDVGLKHKVFAEIEDIVAPHALLCSNTSTLPITRARRGSAPAERLHRPALLLPGRQDAAGRGDPRREDQRRGATPGLSSGRLLRKTPIVVGDSRGFFTSRVIGTFTNEGLAMLAEGVPPASIEQASSQAGYPAPVLQLMDELTLTLPRKIRREYQAVAGDAWVAHPADAVIDRMIDEFGRPGRSSGAGFYVYAEGKRAGLWPGLSAFALGGVEAPFEDLKERFLFIEAIESVKCLDEGVLNSVPEANVGSILGIGYPGWTGGVLQYINQYSGGLPGFVDRARELAERYGDRFAPPALLLAKARAGEIFE